MDRKVMYQLPYGLFVLTSATSGQESGCIICPLCKHPVSDFEKVIV